MGVAYDRLIEAIDSHGFKIQHQGKDRARAQCPGHGDSTSDKNLSIAVGDQGVLTKCHVADCPAEDIAKAVGLTLNDLFDKDGRATYDYGNGHKVIRTRTREGKKVVQSGHPGSVTQLYRHPDSVPLEEATRVVLVEGEKSVDAALRLGEPCVTTWPGGAKGVASVDLSPLHGKEIVVIADNDEPGFQAALELRRRLEAVATFVGVWTAKGEVGCKRSTDDIWVDGESLVDGLMPANHLLPVEETEPEPDRHAVTTWMSDVQSKPMKFLWDDVIPAGCLTLLAGQGGVAKSTFALWLAGQIGRGTLKGVHQGVGQRVLYVSHEDSLAEVVKPRAVANGVDTAMLGQLGVHSEELGGIVVPRLPDDIDIVRQAVVASGAKVIIIDPIASTIGGDTDKVADVRAALDPLNVLGQELGISVLAIAHLRKGSGAGAHLISGSHAYRDAARCVLLFARDDENNQTVFTVEKSNYGEAGHSFAFDVEVIDHMTDSGEFAKVGRVHSVVPSASSAADLINKASSTDRRKEKVTAPEVAKWAEGFGTGAFKTSDAEDAFEDVPGVVVRRLLQELVRKGILVQPAAGLWQLQSTYVPPPPPPSLGYCRVCGGEEPCYRQHTPEEHATAAARAR